MRGSLKPSGSRQCRRAAGLRFLGVGLVAAAATLTVADRSSGSYLDQHAQTERALPAPSAQAVSLALGAQRSVNAKPPAHAIRKQMPPPTRIIIPAIRVSARIIPLGLNRNRTIQVPRSFSVAGW